MKSNQLLTIAVVIILAWWLLRTNAEPFGVGRSAMVKYCVEHLGVGNTERCQFLCNDDAAGYYDQCVAQGTVNPHPVAGYDPLKSHCFGAAIKFGHPEILPK